MVITLILVFPFVCYAFETGEYLSFGSYGGEPIVWRVTDVEGDTVYLISDKIICLKSLDAEDANWSTSDLRDWLNSSADNVEDYGELGFLNSANFSDFDRAILMESFHETIINKSYAEIASSGSEPYHYSNSVIIDEEKLSLAYKKSVADKMYLPGVEQISKLYSNKSDFGVEYNMAIPTAYAALQGKGAGASSTGNWFYWTGDALSFSADTSNAIMMTNTNVLTYANSYNTTVGVRPMCCINAKVTVTLSGEGTENAPYIVTGVSDTEGNPFVTFEHSGLQVKVSVYGYSESNVPDGNLIIAGYSEKYERLTCADYGRLTTPVDGVIRKTVPIDENTKHIKVYIWDFNLNSLAKVAEWTVE